MTTTSGPVALANLHAQIEGLHCAHTTVGLPAAQTATLIDLLALRGRLLGRISDYDYASQLAETLCTASPFDDTALLARARTRALLHRFNDALDDLDAAEPLGADAREIGLQRAGVLQALGRYDEAAGILHGIAGGCTDFTAVSALATLSADRGDTDQAEQLFDEARNRYRGVSPIPLTDLDFHQGHMWQRGGELNRAQHWLTAAHRRMPQHAPAGAHLAAIHAALGDNRIAIDLLRPLATSAEDPTYAATLARVLHQAGRHAEAQTWRSHAATRYEYLLQRHLNAFADHAAEFFLQPGGDPDRAYALAQHNLTIRPTRRARALLTRARTTQPAQP